MATELEKIIDTFLPSIESLPDYEEATPRTREAYRLLSDRLSIQVRRLASPHSRTSSQSVSCSRSSTRNLSHADEDEHPLTKKQIARQKLINRGENILSYSFKMPLHPEELVALVTAIPEQTREQAENSAFQRIFQGYERVPIKKWVRYWLSIFSFRSLHFLQRDLFSQVTDHEIAFSTFCERSDSVDTIMDDMQRLAERHLLVRSSEAAMQSVNFVLRVLSSIENIKFASEWNEKGTGVGGNTWKGKFYSKCFQSEYSDVFGGLNVEDTALTMITMSTEFTAYKKTWESTVTARNQLLDLYRHFDAAILIDPFWDANNLGPKRKKQFKPLYEYLARQQPMVFEDDDEIPKLTRLNEANQQNIVSICTVLAGNEIGKHVKAFLDGCY